jgi:hypothetical protein
MKKILFSALVSSAVVFAPAAIADAAKCSPCQAARQSRQDAIQKSMNDAQAALAAGGAFSREQDLDTDSDRGCKPCQSKTRSDVVAMLDNADAVSLIEAANAALAAAQAIMESKLDEIPADGLRAPREELADPCNPCVVVPCDDPCNTIEAQIKALRCCCAQLTQRVACQGHEARKNYKKLKHDIQDVEELVETVIDQSAECCSVTDTRLGDLGGSVLDIPLCQFGSITDIVNNIDDADVITWLKSIYALLYQVHLCTCCL